MRHYKVSTRVLFSALLTVVFMTGCGKGGSTGTGAAADAAAPRVTHLSAANGARDISTNSAINATFSKAMDPSTLTAETFYVPEAGSGSVTYDAASHTATFTPTGGFPANTRCTATITTGVKDTGGNGLATQCTWHFMTCGTPDTTPPVVTSTCPVSCAMDVCLNTKITATFSESMQPSTINTTTFTLTNGGTTVAGVVTYSDAGMTATFAPSGPLTLNTTYTATITTGAQDLAGNALASNYVWTFTTGSSPDTVAPGVDSTHPANGETGVATNVHVNAAFSEAMDASTMTTANFTVTGPGSTPVTGTVAYDASSRSATFTPDSDFATLTTYTATITTGVKDLAGNSLPADYVWTFTTAASPDTTAPVVTSTIPADTATGVPLNTQVTATFSESMQPSTINASTFTLAQGATPVPGAVSYADVGRTATFTPASSLAAGTTYTATVTTGATDLADNAMAANYVWSFTTGVAADATAPTVIATSPADTETDVAINKKVNATFSEPMDSTTITTLTYTLAGPGSTPVSGTVAYDAPSRIATFTPATNLAANTEYTATITTGAKDLAGNPLASDYVWTFTTGAGADQEPVDLGSAAQFAVLAYSTITNTGPTIITGDVGLSPGTAVVGFPPGVVLGTIHAADLVAAQAKLDLTTAFNDIQARSTGAISLPGNLGGLTLTPGLYNNASTVQISGTGSNAILTLDAQGDSTAIFIFQVGSTLTLDPGTSIVLANGAQAANIYWSVGSSATLGTTSVFNGTILADQSITVQTGARLNGRALARNAAVTLDSNIVARPSP